MKTIKFKQLVYIFLITSVTAFGQKQQKKYTETFNVNPDVTVEINTSYTNIEFETWNRNVVEVVALIEVEDVSKEEATEIFKNWDFKAEGNSSKVSISTKPAIKWAHANAMIIDDKDFEFNFVMPEIPEIPEIHPFVMEIPEMAPMPPMPPMPMNFGDLSFDYEAYKKDGDKYLQAWKKKFNENFDENFKANLEEWKKEMDIHKKEMEKHRNEIRIEQDKVRNEHEKMRVEQRVEMDKVRAVAREQAKKAREEVVIIREKAKNKAGKDPNVFYFSTHDGEKNLKVKKTIKIKIPKGAKLKMNVRHGEVKLSSLYKNINATLSHTRLHASVIDGENTLIEASYSPVLVDNWNYGELKLNYVKEVDLKNVKSMKLSSKSSDVFIGNLMGDAIISGSFGDLEIAHVSDTFKRLEVVLDNSDAVLALPQSAYDFYCSSTDSKVVFPKRLVLDVSKKYSNQLAKGYNKQKNSNKTVSIVATYSDVKVQ